MYEIVWTINANKELKMLPRLISKRIFQKITELRSDPYRNSKKMINNSAFRLRVGKYRVLYEIDNKRIIILILAVKHRKNVYKN